MRARMSPDQARAEDLFFDWLMGLPERSDPSVAARVWLAELTADSAPSPARARLCELLRQVTPFAAPTPQRRQGVRTVRRDGPANSAA
jgi:hypothetical protein